MICIVTRKYMTLWILLSPKNSVTSCFAIAKPGPNQAWPRPGPGPGQPWSGPGLVNPAWSGPDLAASSTEPDALLLLYQKPGCRGHNGDFELGWKKAAKRHGCVWLKS